jgi:hypothetical protein
VPSSVNIGLTLGALAGLLFFIADLYAMLHMIQQIFAPKSHWAWLQNMGRRWHPIHYYGNIALVIVVVIHAVIMLPYTGIWNWLFLALICWMGIAGMLMKFSHLPPKTKGAIAKFHARWYMILLALILLIVSHLTSISSFPYKLG